MYCMSSETRPETHSETLHLLYFARLREDLGCAEETFVLNPSLQTVQALREALIARGAAWAKALDGARAVRVAVNQTMARADTPIKAGDEVAFFPPVTGG
jgi:molybdopterin synthase sulfur carrier subunit